jgi:hypothetical protein
MNRLFISGLVVLIGISVLSSFYTFRMGQDELERREAIFQENQQLNIQIAETEYLLLQIEEKISETETLILQEEKTQKEIQHKIDGLNAKKSEIEGEVKQYRTLAVNDPRVLITVDDPVVGAKVEEITTPYSTPGQTQYALFAYVRDEIEYTTEGNPKKWEYPRSFLQFKSDFWQLPRETIEWGKGDCEDLAILMCTLLRAEGVGASHVRIVLGAVDFGGGQSGHAWIELKMNGTWYVLETTCTSCNFVKKSDYYDYFSAEVWGWFNDKEYHAEKSFEIGKTDCSVV